LEVDAMADIVRRCEYYYTSIPNQVGAGSKILNALKAEAISLVAFSGFPMCLGRAQLDFVVTDREAFLTAAKKAGIKLVGPRIAFLIQDEDRTGAAADVLSKLEQAKINITSVQAIASGEGRYGAILWVKPRDIDKAAQALGIS
jgi:hypothetical protein